MPAISVLHLQTAWQIFLQGILRSLNLKGNYLSLLFSSLLAWLFSGLIHWYTRCGRERLPLLPFNRARPREVKPVPQLPRATVAMGCFRKLDGFPTEMITLSCIKLGSNLPLWTLIVISFITWCMAPAGLWLLISGLKHRLWGENDVRGELRQIHEDSNDSAIIPQWCHFLKLLLMEILRMLWLVSSIPGLWLSRPPGMERQHAVVHLVLPANKNGHSNYLPFFHLWHAKLFLGDSSSWAEYFCFRCST